MLDLLKDNTAKQELKISNLSVALHRVEHKDELPEEELKVFEGLIEEKALGQLSAILLVSKFKQLNPAVFREVSDSSFPKE